MGARKAMFCDYQCNVCGWRLIDCYIDHQPNQICIRCGKNDWGKSYSLEKARPVFPSNSGEAEKFLRYLLIRSEDKDSTFNLQAHVPEIKRILGDE